MTSDRVIRPGEMFIIDINGVSFQGYRTCYYRTHCVGDKPTEKQREIYKACLEYQLTMENSIKPNITNHDYAKAVIKKNPKWPGPGWPKVGRYWTPTNHELGLCSDDPGPGLNATPVGLERPKFTIEKGMVFAVEVGCWDWDGKKWAYDGVKLENSGVATDTGFEVFGRFPIKDLITCGLPGVY
ncbi:MAG: M24 family metallopeptidase [Candidatus Bathyarchaeota archaeon]